MDCNTALFALADVAGATSLHSGTVLELTGRHLFPAPAHMRPLLWREADVRRWVRGTAAESRGVKVAASARSD